MIAQRLAGPLWRNSLSFAARLFLVGTMVRFEGSVMALLGAALSRTGFSSSFPLWA